MTSITIYHNPKCGTSRNALAMIRNAGIEPHIVEYLKTPPSRALLESLMRSARLPGGLRAANDRGHGPGRGLSGRIADPR